MLLTSAMTVYAKESSTENLKSEVESQIGEMLSMIDTYSPETIDIRNAIAIYNADTDSVYYIVPIFHANECLGTFEVSSLGDVSLSEETELYNQIKKYNSEYLLYTTDGMIYAENPKEVQKLYDSCFHLSFQNDFLRKDYTEKAKLIEKHVKATASDYAGASTSQTISAFSHYGLSYSSMTSKLSWTRVKNNINNNNPFVICITSSGGGHMLTGYGFSCQYGDDESYADARYVQVWDPNGTKRTLKYSASRYSIYGYSWRWVETLVH